MESIIKELWHGNIIPQKGVGELKKDQSAMDWSFLLLLCKYVVGNVDSCISDFVNLEYDRIRISRIVWI